MRSIALAVFCLFFASVGTASASEPTSIYVLVEKVELEPENAPKRIKIFGVFMNDIGPNTPSEPIYGPVSGWAIFKLPTKKEDLARLEWKDIKGATGNAVALGSAHAEVFHPAVGNHVNEVREQALEVEYPVGHGLYLLRKDSPPDKKLRDFRKNNPAPR